MELGRIAAVGVTVFGFQYGAACQSSAVGIGHLGEPELKAAQQQRSAGHGLGTGDGDVGFTGHGVFIGKVQFVGCHIAGAVLDHHRVAVGHTKLGGVAVNGDRESLDSVSYAAHLLRVGMKKAPAIASALWIIC